MLGRLAPRTTELLREWYNNHIRENKRPSHYSRNDRKLNRCRWNRSHKSIKHQSQDRRTKSLRTRDTEYTINRILCAEICCKSSGMRMGQKRRQTTADNKIETFRN